MDLKDARELVGLSQSELDRRASLPRGTVSDIEAGRNLNPSVTSALALISALQRAGAKGVTVESIFGEGKVA